MRNFCYSIFQCENFVGPYLAALFCRNYEVAVAQVVRSWIH